MDNRLAVLLAAVFISFSICDAKVLSNGGFEIENDTFSIAKCRYELPCAPQTTPTNFTVITPQNWTVGLTRENPLSHPTPLLHGDFLMLDSSDAIVGSRSLKMWTIPPGFRSANALTVTCENTSSVKNPEVMQNFTIESQNIVIQYYVRDCSDAPPYFQPVDDFFGLLRTCDVEEDYMYYSTNPKGNYRIVLRSYSEKDGSLLANESRTFAFEASPNWESRQYMVLNLDINRNYTLSFKLDPTSDADGNVYCIKIDNITISDAANILTTTAEENMTDYITDMDTKTTAAITSTSSIHTGPTSPGIWEFTTATVSRFGDGVLLVDMEIQGEGLCDPNRFTINCSMANGTQKRIATNSGTQESYAERHCPGGTLPYLFENIPVTEDCRTLHFYWQDEPTNVTNVTFDTNIFDYREKYQYLEKVGYEYAEKEPYLYPGFAYDFDFYLNGTMAYKIYNWKCGTYSDTAGGVCSGELFPLTFSYYRASGEKIYDYSTSETIVPGQNNLTLSWNGIADFQNGDYIKWIVQEKTTAGHLYEAYPMNTSGNATIAADITACVDSCVGTTLYNATLLDANTCQIEVQEDSKACGYLATGEVNETAGIFDWASGIGSGLGLGSSSVLVLISILFSVGMAGMAASQIKDNPTVPVVALIGTLGAFTYIGWFPDWFFIVLVVIAGFMFAKTMGVFGGGKE
jgi:hypothetical protein